MATDEPPEDWDAWDDCEDWDDCAEDDPPPAADVTPPAEPALGCEETAALGVDVTVTGALDGVPSELLLHAARAAVAATAAHTAAVTRLVGMIMFSAIPS